MRFAVSTQTTVPILFAYCFSTCFNIFRVPFSYCFSTVSVPVFHSFFHTVHVLYTYPSYRSCTDFVLLDTEKCLFVHVVYYLKFSMFHTVYNVLVFFLISSFFLKKKHHTIINCQQK